MGFIFGVLTFIGILSLIEYRKEAQLGRWNKEIDNKINSLKEDEYLDPYGNICKFKNYYKKA